jgi:hypothetical protein
MNVGLLAGTIACSSEKTGLCPLQTVFAHYRPSRALKKPLNLAGFSFQKR